MGVRALLYPPFVVKTRMQVEKGIKGMSAFQVARETVRGEGVRGLYKVWKMYRSFKVYKNVVVLCCVVLCSVVLCCVVLCCAVMCCVVLCCVVLCCVVLCCVVLCCVVLCCVVCDLTHGPR